jgi:hypothetical protein
MDIGLSFASMHRRGAGESSRTCPHENQDALRLPRRSLARPCHLDRNAFPHARPEMACRYRTGRVALRETARLKIVPQVREEGKRCPLGNRGSRGALACGAHHPAAGRADRA